MHRLNRRHRLHEPPPADVARKLGLLAFILSGAVATSACNEKHGCCYDVVCPVPPVPLGAIVSPQSVTLAVGDTARFVALITGSVGDPCKADVKPSSRAVAWSVSDAAVAGIVATPDSNTVIVRGIAPGTASVIATSVAAPTIKAAGLLLVR